MSARVACVAVTPPRSPRLQSGEVHNDGMRLHGRSQLDDLAAEAATVLQVEREFVGTWIDAYRAAAEEHLVREDQRFRTQKSNGVRWVRERGLREGGVA